jgi:hypothetical protein
MGNNTSGIKATTGMGKASLTHNMTMRAAQATAFCAFTSNAKGFAMSSMQKTAKLISSQVDCFLIIQNGAIEGKKIIRFIFPTVLLSNKMGCPTATKKKW